MHTTRLYMVSFLSISLSVRISMCVAMYTDVYSEYAIAMCVDVWLEQPCEACSGNHHTIQWCIINKLQFCEKQFWTI